MDSPPGECWPDDLPPLPEKAALYIADVFAAVDELPAPATVVIFGSLTHGGFSENVSDVDLLLVLDDKTTKPTIRQLDREITRLEFQHGFRKRTTAKLDPIYRWISSLTGMFVSHFACRRRDFIEARFARVFGVNRPLCFLFAPARIAWASILSTARVIRGGTDLLEEVARPPITRHQLRKSRAMTRLLCLAALASRPFHPDATKFAMESLKWTIHACHYCYTRQTLDLASEIAFFSSQSGFESLVPLLDRMQELRNQYQQDSRFIRSTLGKLPHFHRLTLRQNSFPILPDHPGNPKQTTSD